MNCSRIVDNQTCLEQLVESLENDIHLEDDEPRTVTAFAKFYGKMLGSAAHRDYNIWMCEGCYSEARDLGRS